MYEPVPAKVIAINGQIFKGLCPGFGLGPAPPDAKRRAVFLKAAGTCGDLVVGLMELAKR